MEELENRDLGDVMIYVVAVKKKKNLAVLKEQDVSKIFGPGSSLRAIGEWLEQALDERENA